VGIVGGALLDDSLRFPVDVVHGLQLPVLTMIRHTPIEVSQAYGRYALPHFDQSMPATMQERPALPAPLETEHNVRYNQRITMTHQPLPRGNEPESPLYGNERKRNPLFR
jgi:hypothetical protein